MIRSSFCILLGCQVLLQYDKSKNVLEQISSKI